MENKPAQTKFVPNERLIEARKARGWRQQDVADRLHVSLDAVRYWERGRRNPSPKRRKQLCDLYEMSAGELGLETREETGEAVFEEQENLGQVDLRRVKINRRRMISQVRGIWMPILDESLHKAALITLGLQELPSALENPWRLAVSQSDRSSRLLPPETSIVQVYDDSDGDLLILGEPGAGKTTLLLALTRALLRRAEQDDEEPIPVVFTLSSWAIKQQPLDEWLKEELFLKYHVPRRLGEEWIQGDKLTILLDGLDEVAGDRRAACVQAINQYKDDHEIVPVVVCCQSKEYFSIETRVGLRLAIQIQPLTMQQIDQYVASMGKQLTVVRTALEEDIDLREMARSPLMLSIFVLTYRGLGKSSEGFFLKGSFDERRRQVLSHYVQRMLSRRVPGRYPDTQTVRWLTWLAQQMRQHNLSEFYVERMQPDWLGSGPPRDHYRSLALRFIYGIEAIVIAALFAWIRGGKVGQAQTFGVGSGLFGQLGAGPGNVIFAWMAPGVGGGVEAGGSLGVIIAVAVTLLTLLIGTAALPAISLQSGWHGFKNGLKNGLLAGIVVSLFCVPIFGVVGGFLHGIRYGLGMGLFSALLVGLLSGLLAGARYTPARDQVQPAVPHYRSFRTRCFDGLTHGLCAGVSFALVDSALHIATESVVVYSTIAGIFFFLTFGFAGGSDLIPGLGVVIKPAESVSWSWTSMIRSIPETLLKGLLTALFITLSVGSVMALGSGIFYGSAYGVRYGLIYGVIIGVIVGLTGILASLLNSGWSSNMLPAGQLFRPNQGIRRSLINAVLAGILFAPIGGILSGIVCGAAFGLIGGLAGWLILGAGFAFVFGILIGFEFFMIDGGSAWIEHYLLRWQLWRAGCMPLNYIRFLDYAASRLLLHKVGAGYIFAHRILLDYFASLDQPTGNDTP
jgi:transcriptional regulator with XRE-family HTH domain/DNA polymerase III delta prime subunit